MILVVHAILVRECEFVQRGARARVGLAGDQHPLVRLPSCSTTFSFLFASLQDRQTGPHFRSSRQMVVQQQSEDCHRTPIFDSNYDKQ